MDNKAKDKGLGIEETMRTMHKRIGSSSAAFAKILALDSACGLQLYQVALELSRMHSLRYRTRSRRHELRSTQPVPPRSSRLRNAGGISKRASRFQLRLGRTSKWFENRSQKERGMAGRHNFRRIDRYRPQPREDHRKALPPPLPPRIPERSVEGLQDDEYYPVKQLQEGGEGWTALVQHRKSRKLVVVKTVVDPYMCKDIPKEARVFQDIERHSRKHPNIITFERWTYIDALYRPIAQYWLEYCEYGDLMDLIGRYKERNVDIPEMLIWRLFRQMASALEYLHEGFYIDTLGKRRSHDLSYARGIVHRDIKPDNILIRRAHSRSYYPVDEGMEPYPDFVLCDFGHASSDQFSYKENCGTDAYSAPEMPRKSPKGDVYSLGATVHCLIHRGQPPIAPMPRSWHRTKSNMEIWESRPEARSAMLVPDFYTVWLEQSMLYALLPEDRRPNAGLMADLLERDYKQAKERYPDAREVGLPVWALKG